MHSRANDRLNIVCTDSTVCRAVYSMMLHYVSSGLDATHAEGDQCSEICDQPRQPCSSIAEVKVMVIALWQSISWDNKVSQVTHESTIQFDLHNCYHCSLKIIKPLADKYYWYNVGIKDMRNNNRVTCHMPEDFWYLPNRMERHLKTPRRTDFKMFYFLSCILFLFRSLGKTSTNTVSQPLPF